VKKNLSVKEFMSSNDLTTSSNDLTTTETKFNSMKRRYQNYWNRLNNNQSVHLVKDEDEIQHKKVKTEDQNSKAKSDVSEGLSIRENLRLLCRMRPELINKTDKENIPTSSD
jgi:hypothetical protein